MTTSSGAIRTLGRSLVADAKDGPLPAVLLVLTVVSGVVDAVSILTLGRVFVANMTGNVIFVGFGIARVPGFSLVATLCALGGFLIGAGLGGEVVRRSTMSRAVLLRNCLGIEVLLVLSCVSVALIAGEHLGPGSRHFIAGLTAAAMGLQNAVARKLAVADLTTTVLTTTLSALAADLRVGPGGSVIGRRVLAVVAMVLGAGAGAELVERVDTAAALALAAALLAAAGAAVALLERPDSDWT